MTGDRQMFPVQTMSTRTGRAWQSPRTRRVAVAVVAVSLVLLLAGASWLAYRGAVAVREADAARTQITQAQQAYASQDLSAGAAHLAAAGEHLATAHLVTADPVWAIAATAPVLGDDVGAVATVLASASDLLDAVEPVAGAAAEAGPEGLLGLLQDGAVAADLRMASDQAAGARATLDGLDPDGLLGPVGSQVASYSRQLEQLTPLLVGAADAAELAPRLLGPDQPAPLLVAVQTPAEVRSLGGLVGLVLEVRAEEGRLEVLDAYSGSSVPAAATPVLTSPDLEATYDLLGDRAGRFLINATMLPDAADASALLAEHHRLRGGGSPAGVVLTDLTVLSRLLEATGPATLPDGRLLDAASSDALLQHGIYVEQPDPAAQDLFFAATARAVVDRVGEPGVDPVALARALAGAAGEGRLSLWSPDERSQQLIDELGVAGDRLSDPGSVGVFLNDAAGSKMQWFLRTAVSVAPGPSGGSTLRVELESTAPSEGLPRYVTGRYERLGLPPGGQRVQVGLFGPVGDGPSRWRVDGAETASGSGVVDGRGVGVLSVDVAPGQRVVVEVDLARTDDLDPGRLVTTPGVRTGDR